jgi:Rap1a immunity proteins
MLNFLRLLAVFVPVMMPKALFAGDAFLGGSALYSLCTGKPIERIDCLGYVTAIFDALVTGNNINGYRSCPPVATSRGQVTDIVVTYLRAHPERQQRAAAGLVAHALQDAFPCR